MPPLKERNREAARGKRPARRTPSPHYAIAQAMHPMLNTAVKAARRAGNLINRAAQNLDILTVSEKAANEFVSEVDREAERAIIKVLLEAYPKHAILAEESGATGASEFQWIIDPLDGTTNFLHGFPQYAVSIALARKDVVVQGVIYDPVRNDLFTASRGSGAYLNDHRIRVSKRSRLRDSLIGTGFPFREFSSIDAYLAMFRDMTQKTAGVRRAGAAALDLAYVAAGRLDGFWEFGLSPWDMAAGSLLITEAGGMVGDLQGNSGYLKSGNIAAGNPKVFAQLLQVIQPHLTSHLKTSA
jgi:myo-inositol-1(or 4)-monophosphatase